MALDITAFLSNNAELPETSKRECLSLRSHIEDELFRLEAEIAHAQFTLRPILLVTAPHRSLPNEILSTIFRYTISAVDHLRLPYNESSAPVSLLLVCSKWRDISMATPDLWRNVDLDLDDVTCSPAQLISTMGAIVSRSGGILKTLRISGRRVYMTASSAVSHPLIELVKFCLPKVQELALHCHHSSVKRVLMLPPVPTQVLESVDIHTAGGNVCDVEGASPLFRDALNLRRFRLLGSDCYVTPRDAWLRLITNFELSWAELTHLEISKIPLRPQQAKRLLEKCSKLEHCTLDISNTYNNREEDDAPLLLSFLSTLGIEKCDESLGMFLHKLAVPNLKSLRLSFLIQPEYFRNAFQSFMAKVPELEVLNIDFCIPADGIEEILVGLPLLTRLSLLRGPSLLKSTVKKMVAGDIVTRLEALEVASDAETAAELIDMLQCRWSGKNHCAVLREATVHGDERLEAQLSDKSRRGVSKLREEGMVIRFMPNLPSL